MTWFEIGKNHLSAAKLTLNEHPRSSASRSYYAAHVVLAEVLVKAGYVLASSRQTPPHDAQATLITQHLSARGASFVKEMRSLIRRLLNRRLDADYKRTVTVDQAIARDSIREASSFFELLGVR